MSRIAVDQNPFDFIFLQETCAMMDPSAKLINQFKGLSDKALECKSYSIDNILKCNVRWNFESGCSKLITNRCIFPLIHIAAGFEAAPVQLTFASLGSLSWMQYLKSDLVKERLMDNFIVAVSDLLRHPRGLLRIKRVAAGKSPILKLECRWPIQYQCMMWVVHG